MRLVSRIAPFLATGMLAAQSAGAQAVTATAHVVITGGTKPGTYDTQATRAGCSIGALGKGAFGTQISDPKGAADKFNGIQLTVPVPSAAGSTQFEMHVNFGSVLNRSADFSIVTLPNARKPGGKGTVQVQGIDGPAPSATFDVTTADGVHLVGTVNCNSIIRM